MVPQSSYTKLCQHIPVLTLPHLHPTSLGHSFASQDPFLPLSHGLQLNFSHTHIKLFCNNTYVAEFAILRALYFPIFYSHELLPTTPLPGGFEHTLSNCMGYQKPKHSLFNYNYGAAA